VGVDSLDRDRTTPDVQPGREEPKMASAAGWYADPTGNAELRYWDGSAWTQRTKNRADKVSALTGAPKSLVKPKSRQRSEMCAIGWTWTNTRATDRRTRKDYPYEIWFVANALGPNGLYQAAESSITFYDASHNYYWGGAFSPRYRYDYILPRNEFSEASLNDLVKQLWEADWEPTSGGGKGSLWYEYRFRRPVTDQSTGAGEKAHDDGT
jgi:hypothetical protein